MKPPTEPAGNTERAICETTDAVWLGMACRRTVRLETPTNSAIAITPRAARVFAAFSPCGCRKALTPFAIASTPVSAVEPEANARRRTKSVTAPAPAGRECGTVAVGQEPAAQRTTPVPTRANIAVTKAYVGRAKRRPDSRTPRRFATA